MTSPPELIPDRQLVLAAAWFDHRGALKAATGQTDYPWPLLEQLAAQIIHSLDPRIDSLHTIVYPRLQLLVQTSGGQGLLWLLPPSAPLHWAATALALTLAHLQQIESKASIAATDPATASAAPPPAPLLQPTPRSTGADKPDKPPRRRARPATTPATPAPPALIPVGFLAEFEQILGQKTGPTLARKLIQQVADLQMLSLEKLPVARLDAFVHELSIQIPYRARRTLFLTEVNQLMRSHGIHPVRPASPKSKRPPHAG